MATNSLRIRSSASAYLSRTPTVTSNRKTWTWSGWVKRGVLGTDQTIFGCYTAVNTDSGWTMLFFNSSNQIVVNGWSTTWRATSAVFRDPSAWYHIVLAVDTTQATANNRLRLYVNGVEQTAFATLNNPSQNLDLAINTTSTHGIGEIVTYSVKYYYDGYMADINFIDGQALTPNSFGTFNGLGVWQPIRYGGSYGTNGFYLPFNATQSFAGAFNGSNQYLTTPTSANFNTTTNDWTVEFWAYNSSNTRSVACALSPQNTSQSVNITIQIEQTNQSWTAYCGDGSTFVTVNQGPAALLINAWNHIALVRRSGSITLYVNGVGGTAQSLSGSPSNSKSWTIGGVLFPALNFPFSGSISNFRFVNGTAVYTSNFIPQTTALTAITNTQLLTLQNATFVDNSTNAFTITNNGSATTAATYPFAIIANTIRDFSPQGNNWTTNNIGQLSGSTLDTMTDVPTLTSATAANYPVINPLNNSGGTTIADANLKVTWGSASSRSVLSTMAIPSTGKFYAEFVNGTLTSASVASSFGLATTAVARTSDGYGASGAWVYYASNQSYISRNGTSSSQVGSNQTFAAGGIVQVAIDRDNNQAWLGYNNVWVNATNGTDGNPSAGTNPTVSSLPADLFIIIGLYANSGNVNFGQQPFTYTPPTGFVALNTFNLPTPTIGATPATTANKYMDATTYTGNGGTQSITSLGFQPDLVWVKRRNAVASHNLVDAVRGASKILYSDATTAEITDTNDINAFNSNGWTMGLNTDVNASGGTYVGWTWRGANATVTNTAGSIISTVSANTTAGFSIVSYTGNLTSNSTVGHGLGVAPSMIIVKDRDGSNPWPVYHVSLGVQYYTLLNATDASYNNLANYWSSSNPTSTVFGLGAYGGNNPLNSKMIAYCFAPVAGYSRFGSYTGNGSSDGPFVFTGFRPRFLIVKRTNDIGSWIMTDSARSTYNVTGELFNANTSGAEFTTGDIKFDYLSNGFKLREVNGAINASGSSYIYMAFAESPFKYANAR